MKITMLSTHRAALDGINVSLLAAGDELDLDDDLAHAWITRGLAKACGAAPENKDAGRAPANKARRARANRLTASPED